MTIYDDPNREAVGLEPIWTGAGATRKAKTVKTEEPAELDDKPVTKATKK
jgi:hypothetical protein